jgi:protein-S-isoprenylcysteine O-methyltransferase Ste14
MPTVHFNVRQRSLPERIIYAILALALVVLGFFFLAAAVVAGAILAGLLLLRLWWLKRQLKKAADSEFVTTEYTVIERETLPESALDAGETINKRR